MNKSINSILFNNLSKFSIPQNSIDIEYENINMALSVNRNLESYGYTLSTDAISALAKLPAQEICGVYNDLTDIIKEYKGIDEFNSVELFYPNFPEEVMDKSEEALYINSLLYYTFSQLYRMQQKTNAALTEEELNRHISGVLNNMSKKMNDKYNLDENNVSFYLVDGKIKCNIIATQCSMEDLSGMLSEFNNTLRDYRKTSKRNEHALNHGKIAKHSMHLLRLYMMGIDLVSEGKIQTKRIKEHDLLMDIRNGVYLDENGIPNKHFFEIVDEYKNKFENACKNSVLPDEPDIDKINTFRMEVNEKIVKL